jgi:hypothetical protein
MAARRGHEGSDRPRAVTNFYVIPKKADSRDANMAWTRGMRGLTCGPAPRPTRRFRLSGLRCVASAQALRHRTIGLGDYLEQVAVGRIEVDAAAAVIMVDFAFSATVVVGVIVDAGGTDAPERAIELVLADEEREMLMAGVGRIGEVERHAMEAVPLPSEGRAILSADG